MRKYKKQIILVIFSSIFFFITINFIPNSVHAAICSISNCTNNSADYAGCNTFASGAKCSNGGSCCSQISCIAKGGTCTQANTCSSTQNRVGSAGIDANAGCNIGGASGICCVPKSPPKGPPDPCANASCGAGPYCGGACGVVGSNNHLYQCTGVCDPTQKNNSCSLAAGGDNSCSPNSCQRCIIGSDKCGKDQSVCSNNNNTNSPSACENNGGSCKFADSKGQCPNGDTQLNFSCSYSQSGSGTKPPNGLVCCSQQPTSSNNGATASCRSTGGDYGTCADPSVKTNNGCPGSTSPYAPDAANSCSSGLLCCIPDPCKNQQGKPSFSGQCRLNGCLPGEGRAYQNTCNITGAQCCVPDTNKYTPPYHCVNPGPGNTSQKNDIHDGSKPSKPAKSSDGKHVGWCQAWEYCQNTGNSLGYVCENNPCTGSTTGLTGICRAANKCIGTEFADPGGDVVCGGGSCCIPAQAATSLLQADEVASLSDSIKDPKKLQVLEKKILGLAPPGVSTALLASRVLGAQTINANGTLTYDPVTGYFVNHRFKLGTNIPAGTYNIISHIRGYLDAFVRDPNGGKAFAIGTAATTLATGVTVHTAGDVAPGTDGDNFIDILDYNGVLACLGKSPTGSCETSDLNLDGVIDQKDLDIVRANFGKLGESFASPKFNCVQDPACKSGSGSIQFCALTCSKKPFHP